MSEKIDLNKKVFDKNSYIKTIDTKFKEFGVTSIEEDLNATISVDTFFENYNQIFYQISKNGETNSHEYLIKTSGEYVNFEQINEQILALQQEISNLRTEGLQKDIQILELQTGQRLTTGSLQI